MDELSVSLKEYLESVVRNDRELTEANFKERDKALVLFEVEMQRRLEDLNHVHERTVQVHNTYIPRELYAKSHEDLTNRLDLVAQESKSLLLTLQSYLPRELYDRTIEEWVKWRSGVDQSLARSAERKEVYASIIVSGLALIAILANIFMRLTGH